MNTKPTIKNFIIIILPGILTVFIIFFLIMPKVRENRIINNPATTTINQVTKVTNFEECIAAGNPAMESYPRQCRHQDQTFVEDISEDIKGKIAADSGPILTEEEAILIAGNNNECTMVGIPANTATYNNNSKTWWVDLERMPELENDGCSPACVVHEENKTVEVNWRCTGLLPE